MRYAGFGKICNRICDRIFAYNQHPYFVWDGGLYEFTRTPFGQKGSGSKIIRSVQLILHPIRQFAGSYMDDMSVFSDG